MDLREQIKAAMAGEGAETPVEAAPEVPEASAAPEPVEAAPEAASAPERDEQGRFKAKDQQEAGAPTATAEPQPPETVKPEEAEAPKEPIRIPPSLPAAIKAKFETLEPDVQQAFHKLEETVQTAKAEWGRKGERLNRYDEIVGPHLDRWRMAGLDEYTGLQTLIAAQNVLEKDPVGGIVHIARSYGVTPQHLAQAFGFSQANGAQPGAEGHQAPTQSPDITAALQSYLAPIAQRLQTFEQQHEQREFASAQAEVNAFASNPDNRYFENVRPLVAHLIESEQASDLKDAYDKACWMTPEIRDLLLKEQAVKATPAPVETKAATEDAQRKKSTEAKRAARSVTGAPAPGATAPAPGSTGNLRDDILAARAYVESRA